MDNRQRQNDETKTPEHNSPFNPSRRNNANLCEWCSKALAIDDLRAGGYIATTPDGESTTVSFSSKARNKWLKAYPWPPPWKLPNGDRAHRIRSSCPEAPYYGQTYWAVSSDARRVTPPTLPELSDSAAENCHFCGRLKEIFLDQYSERSWWIDPDSWLQFWVQYEWEGCKEASGTRRYIFDAMAVLVQHPEAYPDRSDAFRFAVGAMPGPCREWLQFKDDPLDIEGPMSERNTQLIESWLKECSLSTCCGTVASGSLFIPTRLLDLEPEWIDHGTDGDVRLTETTESHMQTASERSLLRYAALSYCWGSSGPPLRTTSETLAQYKQRIKFDEMPQVFREAVFVARKLRLRYIWMDALCIVQDDTEDWENESVQMSDIFAHSFVTIGAAAASSCHESFLQRASKHTITIPFQSTVNPKVLGQYSVHCLEGEYVKPETPTVPSRWDSRAWVWQEQMMAKRLLVFDKKQLQMRCSQYRRMENGHRLSENYTLDKSFRTDWYTWIRSYSQREITYPRDRLGAVSGVAKYFSRRLKENGRPAEYLAGLWRDESLERDLRWVITEPRLSYKEMMEALNDERSYCTPSWSWASRNQGVDFLCKGISTTFEVKQCHLPPATSDATVAVKPGSYITLRGKLARTPIKPTDGVAIDLDGGSWQSNVAWEVNSPAFGHMRYYLDWAPAIQADLAEENALSRLELLLLARGSARVGRECSGVLLLPFESSRGLLYRRVGAFDSDDRDIPWLTDVLESEVTIV